MRSTPVFGDQGIDLILTKDDTTTVVQCKGQKGRAGSPVVIALIGARENYGTGHAILACTGGFTHSAIDLAKRNRIELISAREMAKMAGSIVQSQQERLISEEATPASFPVAPSSRMGQQQKLLIKAAPASNEPTSPRCDSCGSVMTLRSTKYDKFWRCSRFPNCKGIQNAGQEGLESTISTVEHAQMGLRVKQPERATLKQPATSKTTSPKSHIAPTTQARGGVKQPERTVSRKPVTRLPTGPQCPSCGSAMALMELREGGKGKLWGCPRYPECKGARDLSRRVLRY